MAKATKICRVCGKTYEACRTANINNTFRWQDVSCSVECGTEYLRRIKLSREGVTEAQTDKIEPVVVEVVEEIEVEYEYEEFDEEETEEDDLEEDYIDEFVSEE